MRVNRRIAAVGLTAIAAVGLTGCGSAKISEPFNDADRGRSNTSPADTITFPDGFSNVATKCDNGNRVYVLFKGDAAYGGISVVPNDPTCTR